MKIREKPTAKTEHKAAILIFIIKPDREVPTFALSKRFTAENPLY